MHRTSSLFLVALGVWSGALTLAASAGAQGALVASSGGVSALDAQLVERRARLAQETADRRALEGEQATLPARRRALEATLTRDVRALYRLRRGGLLPIAGGLEAWLRHAARVSHLERMAARELAALRTLDGADTALADKITSASARIGVLEGEISALEHTEALARAQAAAAATPPVVQPSPRMQYGLSFIHSDPESFFSQRGELALPVADARTIRRSEIPGAGARGLAFAGEPGASVRAAAAGQIAFAGDDPNYGKLVVVAHGQGFETRYGHLEAIDVQTGDAISRSTRLGTAGERPVHFEVRRGTRWVDARAWLGLP